MGKPCHDSWQGFTKIRDSKGVIKKAKCNNCSSVYSNHESKFLKRHLTICKVKASDDLSLPVSSHNDETNNATQAITLPMEDFEMEVQGSESITPSSEFRVLDVAGLNHQLLECFLLCNLNFEVIENEAFKKFLTSLNPSYTVPTTDNLKNSIADSTLSAMKKDFSSNSYLMGVYSERDDSNLCVVSFLIQNKKYLFLDFRILDANTQCDENSDEDLTVIDRLKKPLTTFITSCITLAVDTVGVDVEYVLLHSEITLSHRINFNEKDRYISCTFINLIEKLKNLHFNAPAQTPEDRLKLRMYDDTLLAFENYFNGTAEIFLPEAVEKLLELTTTDAFRFHRSVFETIITFSSPVWFAANYLEPKYRGRRFISQDVLKQYMYSFTIRQFDKETLKGFSAYVRNDGLVKTTSALNLQDSHDFWDKISVEHNSFSKTALKLISLPANLRKINLPRIFKTLHDSQMIDYVAAKNILGSLLLNEK